jgi:2-aminoadipate transaminase
MPGGTDCNELLQEAIRRNVAFVPGDCFYPGDDGRRNMRLNFSNATPDQIREGIRRLSVAVKAQLEKHAVLVG